MQDAPDPLHRRSIRLKEYDYAAPGAYFITVVTHGYKCIFGKIINQEMYLNNVGKIVQQCWEEIPNHFANIEIEPFVVMPNHIHGIITINERRGTIYRAPTTGNEPFISRTETIEKYGKPVVGSIPTIVRTFKAAVSRIAKKELGYTHIWQRNYYEHIVRNQVELGDIHTYITSNPSIWLNDPEYTP